MGRLQKLDSFMKESSRLSGILGCKSLGCTVCLILFFNRLVLTVSMNRKATKDFTFSNGLTIPAGYTVAAASEGIHTDPVSRSFAHEIVNLGHILIGDFRKYMKTLIYSKASDSARAERQAQTL